MKPEKRRRRDEEKRRRDEEKRREDEEKKTRAVKEAPRETSARSLTPHAGRNVPLEKPPPSKYTMADVFCTLFACEERTLPVE